MNRGLFEAQLNTIADLLNDIGLGEERVRTPKFPENPRAVFKGLKYKEIWELLYRKQYYHFCLADDSLFQFRVDSYRPLCVHYSFYECPYTPRISFEDFINEYYPEGKFSDDELDELFKNYENYVQATFKDSITPIRYDFDPDLYYPGVHPASHFHFGHGNTIRVGTKRILKPVSFFLFIIRQFYPDQWRVIMGLENVGNICRNIREAIDTVERSYWCPQDEMEMYFV